MPEVLLCHFVSLINPHSSPLGGSYYSYFIGKEIEAQGGYAAGPSTHH